MIIRSNSIILATDLSPAFKKANEFSQYKRGLFPLAFVKNLTFDVQGNRIRSKQIGSQSFSVQNLAFSPTVSLSFDYISPFSFDNENLLGLSFQGWGDFSSIFRELNQKSCNLYFILSDLFGLDLIYQIKDRGNLNGLEVISFGNCTLNNYNLAIASSDFPKTSLQMEASNMEMQVISSDLINVPAINLSVGNKDEAAQLKIHNTEFITNLDALNTSVTGQPILPTYETTVFNIVTQNPQLPSIQISPWANAAVSSIGISIGIDRESSYGFGSDFIYDKKVKFPIVGNLNITATALALNSGVPILTGAMANEPFYSLELQFIDSNELKYLGKSIQELSGLADENYKGFLTNNKSIKIDNAKLESHSHNIDFSSNLTVEFGFSFSCSETDGLKMKWGQRSEKEGAQLFSHEGLKLQSSDGFKIDLDNYLYFKDVVSPIIPALNASPGLSSDGLLLLTRDNTYTGVYISPTPTPTPTPTPITPYPTPTPTPVTPYPTPPPVSTPTPTPVPIPSPTPPPPTPTPTPAPSVVGPFTFTAINDGGYAAINWTSSINATGYTVYRSEDDVSYVEIYNGVDNSYQDYGVLAGGNYYWYNVASFNEVSSYSGDMSMVYFP
jgi:hypothetical protein